MTLASGTRIEMNLNFFSDFIHSMHLGYDAARKFARKLLQTHVFAWRFGRFEYRSQRFYHWIFRHGWRCVLLSSRFYLHRRHVRPRLVFSNLFNVLSKMFSLAVFFHTCLTCFGSDITCSALVFLHWHFLVIMFNLDVFFTSLFTRIDKQVWQHIQYCNS